MTMGPMGTTKVTTQCTACGAETEDGGLCAGDTDTLKVNLVRTVPVLHDLEITYRGGDVRTDGGTIRNPAGPAPLPWNEAASRLIRDLDRHLRTYRFAEPPTIPAPTAPNVLLLCGLALRRAKNVGLIRLHPDAGRYAKELARLLDRAQRVTDRRATMWDYGACDCVSPAQQLHEAPDATTVTCPRCNTQYDAVKLKERQWQAAAGALVTRAEAAQWLAIRYDLTPHRTERVRANIDLWIHRSRVTERPGGLLRFGDVDAQYRKGQEMVAAKAAKNRQAAATQLRSV